MAMLWRPDLGVFSFIRRIRGACPEIVDWGMWLRATKRSTLEAPSLGTTVWGKDLGAVGSEKDYTRGLRAGEIMLACLHKGKWVNG